MPMPTGPTIGILADNLRIRNSVLPIPAKSATGWAEGLGLPRGGETVLYTGLMYQLIPYIEAMNKSREKMEDSWMARYAGVGRHVNRVVNISGLMASPSGDMRKKFDTILVNIALLLKQAGIHFGYLYGEELYSGALIHDLGADDVLKSHAQKVFVVLKRHGVKNIITVDPHTTHMMRSVYPSIVSGYDINVKSYLEALAEKNAGPAVRLGGEVVIHDSCVYTRYENVLGEQRGLLANAGVTVREPRDSGKFTLCCGGPVESLFPKKALESAVKRVDQIKEAGGRAVTMCPICYVNLQKAAGGEVVIEDISSYLAKAYLAKYIKD
ncbi:MAG: heterodisulfide reductase-related iron-sulfur binding cluster [Bacillota bacterium]